MPLDEFVELLAKEIESKGQRSVLEKFDAAVRS
jgi:hypothetical protein